MTNPIADSTKKNSIRRRTRMFPSEFKPVEFSGLPAINFFSTCLAEVKNSVISSYAITTLKDVFKIRNSESKEELFARLYSDYLEKECKNSRDFATRVKAGYSYLQHYELLDDFFQTYNIFRLKQKYIEYSTENKLAMFYQKYQEHHCNKISDYIEIDQPGYAYLLRNKLIDKFCDIYNIERRKACNRNMTKEESFDFFYKKILKKQYKSIGEFKVCERVGYSFLQKNEWWDEFCQKFGLKPQRRCFSGIPKEEIFELLYGEFKENGCQYMADFIRVNNSAYNYLRINNLLNEFREKYNIKSPFGKNKNESIEEKKERIKKYNKEYQLRCKERGKYKTNV